MVGIRLICLLSLLVLRPVLLPAQLDPPSPSGIRDYVERMGPTLIREYQAFVGDSLHGVEVLSIDPDDMHDMHPMELGYYYPHEVYVAESKRFMAYELQELSDSMRSGLESSNRFVRAVVMHELTHAYIYLISREMRYVDGLSVHPTFPTEIWAIHSHESYGATFIEEGLCEYLSERMGEIIPPKKAYRPKTIEDLLDPDKRVAVQYKYAVEFLEPLLDTMQFKSGVKMILHNPPPSLEEILDPPSYYARLKAPGVTKP